MFCFSASALISLLPACPLTLSLHVYNPDAAKSRIQSNSMYASPSSQSGPFANFAISPLEQTRSTTKWNNHHHVLTTRPGYAPFTLERVVST